MELLALFGLMVVLAAVFMIKAATQTNYRVKNRDRRRPPSPRTTTFGDGIDLSNMLD